MQSLTKKTKHSLHWSALERLTGRGLSFVIQILLARLIDPTEFGILALITTFIIFSKILIQSGLGQALVQKKEINRTDVSTVFFFNIVSATLLYFTLYFAAPSIADFYNEQRLIVLIRVLTLGFVIESFAQVQLSLFQRELKFKELFWATTPALIISGLVGVTCAFCRLEVWALVYMQLAYALISTISIWYFSEPQYLPNGSFSLGSLKSLSSFGAGILGANLMNQGVQNIYGIMIGKFYTFGQLGFYDRARTFHRIPTMTFSQIIGRVLFPVFSRVADDNKRIQKAMRHGIPIIAFIMVPAMFWLIVVAEPLVIILLTDKWLPAVPYMRWFPLIGMLMPIGAIQFSIVQAKGKAWLAFWLGVIKNALAIGVLLLTIQHGILEIVIGQVVVAFISNGIVNALTANYLYGYRLREQLADFGPYFFIGLVAAVVGYLCGQSIPTKIPSITLLTQTTALASSYFAMCRLLNLRGLVASLEHLKGFATQP